MYDEIRDELKEKQEELFSWKAQIEMSLAEAPKGKLYRSASNGYEQYYIREPDHNGRIRKKYVRKNERKQLAKIWQRDYDCKILSMIKKRIQPAEFSPSQPKNQHVPAYQGLLCHSPST